jgi:hypothetical protein
MTESEWLACTDPLRLMGFLQASGQESERRYRLFACACVRRIWALLPDAACQDVAEAAESFADGERSSDELAAALARVSFSRRRRGYRRAARHALWYAAFDVDAINKWSPGYASGPQLYLSALASHASLAALDATVQKAARTASEPRLAMRAAKQAEQEAQAILFRDIFGPVAFRHLPTIAPEWLTWNSGLVRRLAEAVYEQRFLPVGTLDSDRLAVLADALEEAGCTEANLLDHLRGPGPHVRGCFVVDLVLGLS